MCIISALNMEEEYGSSAIKAAFCLQGAVQETLWIVSALHQQVTLSEHWAATISSLTEEKKCIFKILLHRGTPPSKSPSIFWGVWSFWSTEKITTLALLHQAGPFTQPPKDSLKTSSPTGLRTSLRLWENCFETSTPPREWPALTPVPWKHDTAGGEHRASSKINTPQIRPLFKMQPQTLLNAVVHGSVFPQPHRMLHRLTLLQSRD